MSARLKAFSVHLSLSALVALLSLALVFHVWYPAPMSVALGVANIFLLMLVVDVVLGPLLTLVVYKQGKKTLKLDLATIALLQVGALVYGLHVVSEGRPAWVVFSVDRFELVRAMDVDTRFPEKVAPKYRTPPFTGPQWVAAVRPEDPQALSDITLEAVFAGLDLQHRPYLYQPLKVAADDIRIRALPLRQLRKFNSPEQVHAALEKWPEADAWLPLWANVRPMVVLINKSSARVVAVVDLAPWS